MPTEHINLRELEGFLFDLDGVVTRTASVHAAAWKRLFDDYLERRAREEGAAFVPFDPVIDYHDMSTAGPGRQVSEAFWRLGASRFPLVLPMTGRRSRR